MKALQRSELKKILFLLLEEEDYTGSIAKKLNKDISTITRQLQIIQKEKILKIRKEKLLNKSIYIVKDDINTFLKLCGAMYESGDQIKFTLTLYFENTFKKYAHKIIENSFKNIQKQTLSKKNILSIMFIIHMSPTAFKLVFDSYNNKDNNFSLNLSTTPYDLIPYFNKLGFKKTQPLIIQYLICALIIDYLQYPATRDHIKTYSCEGFL